WLAWRLRIEGSLGLSCRLSWRGNGCWRWGRRLFVLFLAGFLLAGLALGFTRCALGLLTDAFALLIFDHFGDTGAGFFHDAWKLVPLKLIKGPPDNGRLLGGHAVDCCKRLLYEKNPLHHNHLLVEFGEEVLPVRLKTSGP